MKISFNWLKNLVNIEHTAQEVADLLTASGLEVEGIETFESLKGGLQGLVVGQVLECTKHPDADKLNLTKIDVGAGGEPLQIVCGAPNVAAGQKVIVALVGAKLYPETGEPFEIKKSKIRGAVSEGMLCAEDEIGLGESHAGIIVLPENIKIGMPAADYFKIENDTVFEIGLTPNRSDAASHLGVARDLAAIINSKNLDVVAQISIGGMQPLPTASNINKIKIEVQNPEACKRYSGLVISGISVKPSPEWLQNRLKAIGLRAINNIVDITNFVLHEMGQPLHAFDFEKIKGNTVIVRTAFEGEKFVTLDTIERKLTTNDLVICNKTEPMCIAGVFGGLESGVTEKTTSIFLESAYFDSGFIRKTSKYHALKTDASFRFERGTDPNITVDALNRAANLIFELAGGVLSMDVVDIYPEKLEPYKIAFSYADCDALIGKEIDRVTIKAILTNLGIEIENEGNDALLLNVPRYKTDVTRQADVIEEVMRIYGYNNVEVSKSISYTALNEDKNDDLIVENRVAAALEGFGFNEIMSLSLTKETYYPLENTNVKMLNPLSSDLNVLRGDMLYSGLEAIAYNSNRKNADLKLFEIGRTYEETENEKFKYTEQKHLSVFVTGNIFTENPYQLKQKVDFNYLKSAILNILLKCGLTNLKSVESDYINYEYGLTYLLNNKVITKIGVVNKTTLKKFDINQPVFYADVNWDVLVKAFSKQKIQFTELSKFPTVRRDLALLIDKTIKYQQIEELAFASEKKLLKEVNLFDIYEDEKLGSKKSYALSFTLLNSEATLTDKEIDKVMEKLILNFKEKLGAELR